MRQAISTEIPTIALYNNLETFFGFLKRSQDPDVFRKRMYRGDRGLFWLGDPKLLFATVSSPFAARVCQRWGYPGTELLAPANPTHQLSLDILHEPALLARIVDYAGPSKKIRLVPYATTAEFLQLADVLTCRYGLSVSLPESPSSDHLWLRDYVDSKAGFRAITSACLLSADILPPAFVCKNISQAAGAVDWFLDRDQACVVKADNGESGIGHIVFSPDHGSPGAIQGVLEKNPFLCGDTIIVEKYIRASVDISPSLEFFVPPISEGEPRITYVSRQFFTSFGRFAGVVVSRSLEQACWYPLLAENGLKIANYLQKLGYVGHFDLDAVIDDCDRLFLLEINARRTGGTYVHEFGEFTFGPNYLQKVALMSINSLDCPGINCLDDLLDALSDLLYPRGSTPFGVVITVTSTLAAGEFGCILVADCEAALEKLHRHLLDCLHAAKLSH